MGTCHLLETQIKHVLPFFKASLGVIVLALFCYLKLHINLMMTWKLQLQYNSENIQHKSRINNVITLNSSWICHQVFKSCLYVQPWLWWKQELFELFRLNANNKVNQSKQHLVSKERFQVMNQTKNTNINLSNYVLTSNLHYSNITISWNINPFKTELESYQ